MKRSFTLIELIIVITIISLLSGLILAYYNNFNEEKKLEQEAQKLYDVLILAHQKAVSSDLTPQPGCSSFSGYQLEYSTSNNNYKLTFCCGTSCSSPTDVQLYDLPSTIILSLYPPPIDSIRFLPLTGETDSSGDIEISVKNINLSKCLKVTVSPSGLIKIDLNKISC